MTSDGTQLDGQAPGTDSDGGDGARAAKGAVLTLLGFGGGQVLRLGANLILTRLLVPEMFGVMAIVNSLIAALSMVTDIGLHAGVIQNPRGHEPTFMNTAWTLATERGFALTLVAAVLAPLVAWFYGDPRLLWLIIVGGTATTFMGATSMRLYLANRELKMGRFVVAELGSQLVATVAMLVWALVSPSVWALLSASVVQAVAKLVLSYVLFPGPRPHFVVDKVARAELIHFGRWIFLSTLLGFVANQADRLVFGKIADLTTLGVYSIATTLAAVPGTALGHLSSNVVFPYYARVHNAGGDLAGAYLKARAAMLGFGGWACAGLIAGGPSAIALLYDDRYAGAGLMLQILAAATFVGVVLEGPTGDALIARGEAKWAAYTSAAKVVGIVALVPIGFLAGSRVLDGVVDNAPFFGALIGYSAGELLRYGIATFAATRRGLIGWPMDLRMTVVVITASILGRGAAIGAGAFHLPIVVECGLVAAVVTVVFLPWLLGLKQGLRALRQ